MLGALVGGNRRVWEWWELGVVIRGVRVWSEERYGVESKKQELFGGNYKYIGMAEQGVGWDTEVQQERSLKNWSVGRCRTLDALFRNSDFIQRIYQNVVSGMVIGKKGVLYGQNCLRGTN